MSIKLVSHESWVWQFTTRPLHPHHQGRNFRLKSGDTNSERERGALGPEERGEENGEEVSSSSDSGVWESVVSSPSGVRGGAPAKNGFYCNLISADRLCWQQWQQILHVSIMKSEGTVPLSQKSGGTGTPYTP